MDPATPVTVGLVIAFFGAIGAALGAGLWLLTRFSAVEKSFQAELTRATGKLEASIDEIRVELFGEAKKLTDRVNMMALAQSEMRTWVTENFISGRTSEMLNAGISKSIDNMRSILESRFASQESRLLRIENKVDDQARRSGGG
jgi:hypothetical protein